MIPFLVDRVIYRLARLQAYQTIKDQPEFAEDLWRKRESEDAEFTTDRPAKPRQGKNVPTNGCSSTED